MNTKQISRSSDAATCRKINAIRAAARARLGMTESCRCPTCGRAADAPYERTVGRLEHGGGYAIVEGCVDAHHAGHLIPGGYHAQWFERNCARELRRAKLVALEAK